MSPTGASDPSTTVLRVDVLSGDGVVVLEDVGSGVNLDGIDPDTYPSLRLRVRMGSSVAGRSPVLEGWGVVLGERLRVFLPVVWVW